MAAGIHLASPGRRRGMSSRFVFGINVAFGDLATATLALLAITCLRSGVGMLLVWATNVLGAVDLLHAFYVGNRIGLAPGQQGAAYFIPTVLVPLLLVTHGLAFFFLLGPESAERG